MRLSFVFLALGFIACNGEDDTDLDTDTDEDTNPGGETDEEITARKFAEIINITTAPIADDLTCFAADDDWLVQSVDASLQVDETRTAQVRDFQEGTAVAGATLSIYFDDDLTSTADVLTVVDGNGDGSVTAPSCTPLGIKAIAEGTKDTYQSHRVFGPGTGSQEINSVSNATYTLIPALLGVSVEAENGVIAGALYDCQGDAIQGAQVVLRDADGNIPASLTMKYFVNSFPNRDQVGTSPDGLWVALNVPAGEWIAEAYVSDGAGGHDMVGTTQLTTFSNTIGISSIYYGFDGGVWYPPSCQSTATR